MFTKWFSSRSGIFVHISVVNVTTEAMAAMNGDMDLPLSFIHRHQHGDFGDVSEARRKANLEAIRKNCAIVLSRFKLTNGKVIQVSTELGKYGYNVILGNKFSIGAFETMPYSTCVSIMQ